MSALPSPIAACHSCVSAAYAALPFSGRDRKSNVSGRANRTRTHCRCSRTVAQRRLRHGRRRSRSTSDSSQKGAARRGAAHPGPHPVNGGNQTPVRATSPATIPFNSSESKAYAKKDELARLALGGCGHGRVRVLQPALQRRPGLLRHLEPKVARGQHGQRRGILQRGLAQDENGRARASVSAERAVARPPRPRGSIH